MNSKIKVQKNRLGSAYCFDYCSGSWLDSDMLFVRFRRFERLWCTFSGNISDWCACVYDHLIHFYFAKEVRLN